MTVRPQLKALLAVFERSVEADRLNWAVLDFFDRSPLVCWIKRIEEDGALKVIRVNPAYERIVGVPAGAVVGREDREAWGEEASVPIEAHDREVIATGAAILVTEHVDGRSWRVWKWPIKDGAGEVIAVAGMAEPLG